MRIDAMTAPSRQPIDRPRLDRHRTLRQPITFGPVWARMLAACPSGKAAAMVVDLCERWLTGRPMPASPAGVVRTVHQGRMRVPERAARRAHAAQQARAARRVPARVLEPAAVGWMPAQRTAAGIPAAVFVPAPDRRPARVS